MTKMKRHPPGQGVPTQSAGVIGVKRNFDKKEVAGPEEPATSY